MSPNPAADGQTAGDVHDLITALKPDQERLAQLSKQLQQMESGPGLMDKLKAFRHGGVENAMEKLRDQIADVQQSMFDKVAPDKSASSGMAAAQLQQQLAIDDHFKQEGMPGLLNQDQRRDMEKLIQEDAKKLEALARRQKQDGPDLKEGNAVEKKPSVRETLAQSAGAKGHQGPAVDAPKPRGPSL